MHCGSVEDLEFNHISRDDKEFKLSGDNLDAAWETILIEWEKAELLCAACHSDHTSELWATGQITPWNKNTSPYEHGSMRTYQEQTCRCPSCREAKRQYRMKLIKYSDTV